MRDLRTSLLATAVASLLAGAAGAAPTFDGPVQAEAGYFVDCDVTGTEGGEDASFVTFGSAGSIWLEFQTFAGEELHELSITYRSPETDRSVHVFLDDQDLGTLLLPVTHDGEWKTIPIPTEVLAPGFHMLNLSGWPRGLGDRGRLGGDLRLRQLELQ